MAQFRATIKGSRGVASRLGTKKSGIVCSVNGWNSGIRVEAFYDKDSGQDVFTVFETGGSNGSTGRMVARSV